MGETEASYSKTKQQLKETVLGGSDWRPEQRSFIPSGLYWGRIIPGNVLGAWGKMMDGTYCFRLSCWKIPREGSRRQRLGTMNIRRTQK